MLGTELRSSANTLPGHLSSPSSWALGLPTGLDMLKAWKIKLFQQTVDVLILDSYKSLCTHTCAHVCEARGRHHVPCSSLVYCLSTGSLTDLELVWWPASPTSSPVSTSHSTGVSRMRGGVQLFTLTLGSHSTGVSLTHARPCPASDPRDLNSGPQASAAAL